MLRRTIRMYDKGICLSKAFICMIFFLYKQNMLIFYQGDGYLWTHSCTYTSHIDHFTHEHTAFDQSAACLSVFLESFPGLIPFAILWHAGWPLEKKQLHENELQLSAYNIVQRYTFLVENIYLQFLLMNFSGSKWKIVNDTRNTYIWVKIILNMVVR